MSVTPAAKAKMLTAEAVKSVGQLSLESIAIASVALVRAKIRFKGMPRRSQCGTFYLKGSWTGAEIVLFEACNEAGLL